MEDIQGTAHPLDTPLILECIFKNLGVSELKRCRLVNRIWHEEATLAMQSVATVKFISDMDGVAADKIKGFMDLVQSELSTFETLAFASKYVMHRVRMDQPEFWGFCGSSIKSLHLSRISFDSANLFRDVIFQSCPNLEKLILFHVRVPGSRNNEQPLVWIPPRFPQNLNLKRLEFGTDIFLGEISFVELLSHFPSLEEVHLDCAHNNASKICQALATCREHEPQSWRIRKISLNFDFLRKPESDLRFLLDDDISLERLAIYYVKLSEHVSVLRNILRANSTTLKSLKMVEVSEGKILNSMPVLQNVVDISLEWTQIKSLSFLRNLPNLKKLEISLCKFSFDVEPLDDWVASNCKELTIDFRNFFERGRWEEDVLKLFRRIPNVEKLRVTSCTNKLFAGICGTFQNLVCLELENGEVDDCGVSGLDKKHVKRINKKGSSFRECRKLVSEPRPYLSYLKNLKWFCCVAVLDEIKPFGFCGALCVQQLPQLQHLKVETQALPIWDRLHDQFPWRDP